MGATNSPLADPTRETTRTICRIAYLKRRTKNKNLLKADLSKF
jgi:hypothetical protein